MGVFFVCISLACIWHTRHNKKMNKPESHELFVLKEGEKKISYLPDTKIQNAATFNIEKKDHTIGNLLRMQLLSDPDVVFAGYKVPHPLKHTTVIKVQTNHNSSPVAAMTNALTDLLGEFNLLSERFNSALEKHQPTTSAYYDE